MNMSKDDENVNNFRKIKNAISRLSVKIAYNSDNIEKWGACRKVAENDKYTHEKCQIN